VISFVEEYTMKPNPCWAILALTCLACDAEPEREWTESNEHDSGSERDASVSSTAGEDAGKNYRALAPGAGPDRKVLAYDEVSPLGFSAADAAEMFDRVFTANVLYVGGGESRLKLSVQATGGELTGFLRLWDADPEEPPPTAAMGRIGQYALYLNVDVTFTTDDGLFDEHLNTDLEVLDADSAEISVWLAGDEIEGAHTLPLGDLEGEFAEGGGEVGFQVDLRTDGTTHGRIWDSRLTSDRSTLATW
jgi:hypothetical protein